MNKRANVLVVVLLILALILIGVGAYFYFQNSSHNDLPKYFIAIHMEPYVNDSDFNVNYQVLKEYVARADLYNIKLTLMLTPEWVDYLLKSENAEKLAQLKNWAAEGHEIAAHHHSIYLGGSSVTPARTQKDFAYDGGELTNGGWDGYSNYSLPDVNRYWTTMRGNGTITVYKGTLSNYFDKLKQLSPTIQAGCMNEAYDLNEIPDGIVNLTCLGLPTLNNASLGGPGNQIMGVNKYIISGNVKGVKRYWLTHVQLPPDTNSPIQNNPLGSLKDLKNLFDKLDNSVVQGSVSHNKATNQVSVDSWLDYLHTKDPQGKMSRTVSQVIDQRLLPEWNMNLDNTKFDCDTGDKLCSIPEKLSGSCLSDCKASILPPQGNCGDGKCDAIETANPSLCPADCS